MEKVVIAIIVGLALFSLPKNGYGEGKELFVESARYIPQRTGESMPFVAEVSVRYRYDDGTHGDTKAGDGQYVYTIGGLPSILTAIIREYISYPINDFRNIPFTLQGGIGISEYVGIFGEDPRVYNHMAGDIYNDGPGDPCSGILGHEPIGSIAGDGIYHRYIRNGSGFVNFIGNDQGVVVDGSSGIFSNVFNWWSFYTTTTNWNGCNYLGICGTNDNCPPDFDGYDAGRFTFPCGKYPGPQCTPDNPLVHFPDCGICDLEIDPDYCKKNLHWTDLLMYDLHGPLVGVGEIPFNASMKLMDPIDLPLEPQYPIQVDYCIGDCVLSDPTNQCSQPVCSGGGNCPIVGTTYNTVYDDGPIDGTPPGHEPPGSIAGDGIYHYGSPALPKSFCSDGCQYLWRIRIVKDDNGTYYPRSNFLCSSHYFQDRVQPNAYSLERPYSFIRGPKLDDGYDIINITPSYAHVGSQIAITVIEPSGWDLGLCPSTYPINVVKPIIFSAGNDINGNPTYVIADACKCTGTDPSLYDPTACIFPKDQNTMTQVIKVMVPQGAVSGMIMVDTSGLGAISNGVNFCVINQGNVCTHSKCW